MTGKAKRFELLIPIQKINHIALKHLQLDKERSHFSVAECTDSSIDISISIQGQANFPMDFIDEVEQRTDYKFDSIFNYLDIVSGTKLPEELAYEVSQRILHCLDLALKTVE